LRELRAQFLDPLDLRDEKENKVPLERLARLRLGEPLVSVGSRVSADRLDPQVRFQDRLDPLDSEDRLEQMGGLTLRLSQLSMI
jgi:hypothetical protein